jgi:dynein intermediate chain 1, axonemal
MKTELLFVGCGSTLAFHPTETNIFLVGTEEGRIYKCSTAYTSIFLTQTEAHYMPVQQIEFNKYDPSVYASCSSDWRVKIWEDERKYANSKLSSQKLPNLF